MTAHTIDVLNRWRWPISTGGLMGMALFLALGFGFPLTPAKQIATLYAQDSAEILARVRGDSLVRKSIDSLVVSTGHSVTLIEGLARARCRETPTLAADVGLPCRALRGDR